MVVRNFQSVLTSVAIAIAVDTSIRTKKRTVVPDVPAERLYDADVS